MKILYTITKSETGGAQVHVAHLARHMKDMGHAVTIMAAPGGWLENEATKIGVRFYPNPYFGNSFNPLRLVKSFHTVRKAISDFNPGVVHCHSSFAGVVTRLVVRGRIPTIFTAHSWAFTDGASLFRKIMASLVERFIARWTKKIICVSEYDRRLALRYKIAEEKKLVTIHNGAEDIASFSPAKEEVIVANGRLAYPKAYVLLLEAFVLSGSNKTLEIISDGPDRHAIESKIRELGIKDRVRLLGDLSRSEVQERLSKAKIFILISKHEGLPLSILEAMAASLPVIASNVGGISEEVDVSSGILVRNNKEEISQAIRQLSLNENLASQMGREGRKRFEQLFTLEKFFNATESVYFEINE